MNPPRIKHIALKVDSIDKATRFYEDVLGMQYVRTREHHGHVSRHLSDGYIDLALMEYESEQAPEALLAGPGPCIHHMGLEVDDLEAGMAALVASGCEILSGSPTQLPIKFRAPDGTVSEMVPPKQPSAQAPSGHAA